MTDGEHDSLWNKIGAIEDRLRRVEYVMIALVVVSSSPKVGGPDLPKVTTAVVNAIGDLFA